MLHRKRKRLSEINVVPYIDVMLVLLLVFMITAPLLYQGLEINLPEANSKEINIDEFQEPLVVEISVDEKIYVSQHNEFNEVVDIEDLSSVVLSLFKKKKIDKVYVKGDKDIAYEKVIGLISIMNEAGINNIGLITLPKNEKK
ncbi:MAG: protein TolR [Gammaproteobacteria bacterium]|nr:protein TolR [Gammaproteobacteria bacterium]|tara:strand:+ start:2128 stop:2556 length:429 start_codon:yes stop_codon:yes gene_type:complete